MSSFREKVRLSVLLFLFSGTLLIWYAVLTEDRGGVLTVAFLDVGQGDAVFIEAPNGNQLMIDGGPDRRVFRALRKHLPFYDRTVDMLIVSNPDKDHIAGFIPFLRRYRVYNVFEPGTQKETEVYKALREELRSEGAGVFTARRGTRIIIDEDIYLDFLFPDRSVTTLSTNVGSIVAKLTYGNTSFLFPGDAPRSIEEYLSDLYGAGLQSDVLKVSHHGSRTSTSERFLGAVSPRYAVISSGERNRFGHPHREVLETLDRLRVETLRTDERGTIVFTSDGETLRLK